MKDNLIFYEEADDECRFYFDMMLPFGTRIKIEEHHRAQRRYKDFILADKLKKELLGPHDYESAYTKPARLHNVVKMNNGKEEIAIVTRHPYYQYFQLTFRVPIQDNQLVWERLYCYCIDLEGRGHIFSEFIEGLQSVMDNDKKMMNWECLRK